MYLVRDHSPVIWPTEAEWHALMRGVSWKLGFEPSRSILYHLANTAVASGKVPPAFAYEYVVDLIVGHVGDLGVELGLTLDHASAICGMVQPWLDSLCVDAHIPMHPIWPSRPVWLAIDRGGSAHAFSDSRRTLSSSLAHVVAVRRRCTLSVATRIVHARIARHARQLALQIGFAPLTAWAIERRLNRALNSFETA